MTIKNISQMRLSERPREKLAALGAEALTDGELMAIMLGSGTKRKPVMRLAREIVGQIDRHDQSLDLNTLKAIYGVGAARATLILAAKEFFRRRSVERKMRITATHQVIPLFSYLNDKNQEHFVTVTLNGAAEVISSRVITVGLVNQAHVHPREVFADALIERATAIIVAHNHPADSLEPSRADIQVTNILKEAGVILGINLIDHIIFNRHGYYSFREKGAFMIWYVSI